eukprot:TRINITY_DN6715_c0_g2_i1.p1 TRINITY_DN6715_c0_g2~~TRINITY_DN6715_c0_g2_i1.p1  ORF type:complete len:541 (+),score=113.13 TRINITY_DN6715_c0_g2_i1:72-1625(+)
MPILPTDDALDEQMSRRFEEITTGRVQWDDEGAHSISADALRLLMKERYLDIESLSEPGMKRFWACHRGMARHADLGIGGLSIRFTAQYNLFSGTVFALGCPDQMEWLKKSHDKGDLGCFMLTEKGAGVLSGLIVEATATYDPARDGFVLRTPTDDSKKVWISQGLVADWGVFMADLVVDGVKHGTHGFLVDMKLPGITLESMGAKTAFNTLDNAVATFEDVFVPKDMLLSKFARIVDGKYVFDGEKPPSFIKIGQRLLSGRLCIADAAVGYFLHCMDRVKKYNETRMVHIGNGKKTSIAELEYVKETFEAIGAVARTNALCLKLLQNDFAEVALKGGEIPRGLQVAINAMKVEGVDHATLSLNKLRCKVGSYSLSADSPFGSTNDILYCMRFAEGDAHVLQQTLTRESIKPRMTPFGLLTLLLELSFTTLLFPILPARHRLRHYLNKHTLVLLIFLKVNTPKYGKLGAWYKSGSLVYNVAKIASLGIIYDMVVSRAGASHDTTVYLKEALKECAGL